MAVQEPCLPREHAPGLRPRHIQVFEVDIEPVNVSASTLRFAVTA
jgi:hypothetical protein